MLASTHGALAAAAQVEVLVELHKGMAVVVAHVVALAAGVVEVAQLLIPTYARYARDACENRCC